MHKAARFGFAIVGVCICSAQLIAQPPAKQTPGTTPSSSSSGALPGLNYPAAQLNQLTKPPDGDDYAFLCYTLVPVISSGAPFSLQSVGLIVGAQYSEPLKRADGKSINADGKPIKKPHKGGDPIVCKIVDADHPLKSRQKIVLVIDTAAIDFTRVQSLNVNLTYTQGTTISQRPQRSNISGSVQFTALGSDHIYYLTVSDRLTGDSIPQLSVTLLYDPPVPGQPWAPQTIYPAGSIINGSGDGHFYYAQNGGMSGPKDPGPGLKPMLDDDVADGAAGSACHWAPYGPTPPSGSQSSPSPWLANNQYAQGNLIFVSRASLFYIETASVPVATNPQNKCTTGPSIPAKFPTAPVIATSEPGPKEFKTNDGDDGKGPLQWLFASDLRCGDSTWRTKHVWKATTPYHIGDQICQSDRVYKVTVAGESGNQPPHFLNSSNQMSLPQWTDIGVYPPSAVTTASASEMQTNAISIPLAQVHALAYYNVDSGVLVSTIRVPSFAYTTPTTINNGTPVQTGSTLLVDPVVTLTRYIWGFDAESKEHLSDWRPGISLSFSLSSPTSNFYVGGSSEVLRYVQVQYGFAVAKVPRLSPGSFAPSSSTTPATYQVFAKGGYMGLSFNLSDFVKNLVKGGS